MYRIGVDLGGTNIVAAVVDGSGAAFRHEQVDWIGKQRHIARNVDARRQYHSKGNCHRKRQLHQMQEMVGQKTDTSGKALRHTSIGVEGLLLLIIFLSRHSQIVFFFDWFAKLHKKAYICNCLIIIKK